MAKKGTVQAEWVKSTPREDGGMSQRHHALRADGKLVFKDIVITGGVGGRRMDWGWKRCDPKVQALADSGLEAMNEALLKAGYKRSV